MARSTEHTVRSERTFGVEIEAYGVSRAILVSTFALHGIACQDQGYNHTTAAVWKLVSDSTIAGSQSFELVSPVLRGASGLAQVKTVCTVLEQLHVRVNRSCGLHIHHDASDLTLAQWKNLAKLYLKYEAAIDSIMPASRRANNNRYCQSLRVRFLNLKAAYAAINRVKTLEALSDILLGDSRYHKLNLTAFWRHGTVEFRQHSGTIEAEKICAWISLTQGLVEKAVSLKRFSAQGDTLESLLKHTKVSAHTRRFYTARQHHFAVAA